MLESIKKLRTLARNMSKQETFNTKCSLICHYADEIEREVSERYMPLPLDADGVPIRVGDKMRNGTVTSIWDSGKGWEIILDYYRSAHRPCDLTHYHRPTIEDVLFEILEKAAPRGFEDGSYVFGLSDDEIAKYADKLREVIADE